MKDVWVDQDVKFRGTGEVTVDEATETQLDYFGEMLGEVRGPELYWFTLHAAPAADIHWMTEAEVAQYELAAP